MRELNGDLRKVSQLYADDFCAIDLNVIQAKHRSSSWLPPGATPTRTL